jgi:outer membrane protein OmpA-like peptidoglycan-associated protein
MSFNPIESVKAVFPGETMNKMAGILGESTSSVQQAMQGIIPSVIIGIILRTEFGDAFDTLNLSKEAAKIEIPFNQTSLAWWWNTNYKGADYLVSLFGGKISDLTNAISGYAGVSTKSASSLLNVVAPAAYSVLGRHIIESDMNVNGLRSFLNSEKKKTLNLLPAGIFLEGIVGFEHLSGLSEKFAGIEPQTVREKQKINWVIPVVIIAVAAGVVWYFLIRQPPAELPSAPNVQSVPNVQSAPNVQKIVPPSDTLAKIIVPDGRYSVKLPEGKLLYVKKGSMEDQLAAFFNDPKSKPSRRFLYSFDQVKFNTGTAVITNESMAQIENVAVILKSFPKARIKIAGFNEKGGDSVLNSELSENRAESIARALKTAGVNQGQITGAEGFGSDFAQYAPDAADSLRAKDRHIAISVREK